MAEDRPSATGSLDWSDLQLILAICRARSLSGAARELGQTHSTIFRRINTVEDRTGVRFFDRHPHGYEMTEAGEAAFRHGERVEAQIRSLELEVLGGDEKLEGRVRLTSPEAFAEDLAPAMIARFNKDHPEIKVDLTPGHSAVDMAKREAEVAIRATRMPPDTAFGKKICNFRFAIYAARGYLQQHPGLSLTDHRWVVIEGSAAWLVGCIFETENAVLERADFQSRSTRSVMSAAAEGMGLAMLPCYFADRYPQVERVTDTIPELDLTLWVLTHNDLKSTARVRALMTHLYDELAQKSDLFEGKTASPTGGNLRPRLDSI